MIRFRFNPLWIALIALLIPLFFHSRELMAGGTGVAGVFATYKAIQLVMVRTHGAGYRGFFSWAITHEEMTAMQLTSSFFVAFAYCFAGALVSWLLFIDSIVELRSPQGIPW